MYRVTVSPAIQTVFNVHCRYKETCSQYSERMFLEKGILKGFYYSVVRILSCNKFTS